MGNLKFQKVVVFTRSSNRILLQKKNMNNSEKDNTNYGFLNFQSIMEINVLNVRSPNILQCGLLETTIYAAKNAFKHTTKV